MNFPTGRRRLAFVSGVIAIVAFLILFVILAAAPQTPPNSVAVRSGDISASVNATGKVRSKRSVRLSLPQSGVVASVSKSEGDSVKAGEIILALRANDAERRVKQAELNLQNRQLDLARAKAAPRDEDVDIARANLQKATLAAAAADAAYAAAQTPQNDGARQVARADLEIARANFNRVANGPSKEELDALQNAVTVAQLELEAARAALVQTKLTAPFNATVTEINVREGELVGGFTPLASIADLSMLEIAAEIDEIDVATVQVGQNVEVRLDAFPGERFNGVLARLYPAAVSQRGSTVYGAIVEFSFGSQNVRPGMGASLKIKTVEKQNVLLVPNNALKNVGARRSVRLVAPGSPRDVIVETGVSNGSETEIVSGLKAGDLVQVQ